MCHIFDLLTCSEEKKTTAPNKVNKESKIHCHTQLFKLAFNGFSLKATQLHTIMDIAADP